MLNELIDYKIFTNLIHKEQFKLFWNDFKSEQFEFKKKEEKVMKRRKNVKK
jgi:hypothetical protein